MFGRLGRVEREKNMMGDLRCRVVCRYMGCMRGGIVRKIGVWDSRVTYEILIDFYMMVDEKR